jgi:hypothetical protein
MKEAYLNLGFLCVIRNMQAGHKSNKVDFVGIKKF